MDLLINELTSKFARTISDDEKEKEELIGAFKEYLQMSIDTIINSNSKFINKSFEGIKDILVFETDRILDMDIVSTKQLLLRDLNLEKIQKIAKEVFEQAKQKLEGKKIVESQKTQQKLEKLSELLEGVKSYNQDIAKELISETILDLKFLDNPDTEIFSLRLYQLKSKMEKATEEREEI